MVQQNISGARGETTIQAGEDEVRVLFTNRALAAAERQLNRSILGVVQGFADGTSGVTETVHVLRAGMEAARRDAREAGRPVTLNAAYDVLDTAGFAAVAAAVMEAVAAVLGYDGADEKPDDDPNA
jgi:phosphatidylserine/phosphatidylglycerophosphate/cardiolipin synthase-like enzyme